MFHIHNFMQKMKKNQRLGYKDKEVWTGKFKSHQPSSLTFAPSLIKVPGIFHLSCEIMH